MAMRAIRDLEVKPDEHFEGIPNKDLSDDEYEALPPEHRELVRESGLWRYKTRAEYQADVEAEEKERAKAIREAEKVTPEAKAANQPPEQGATATPSKETKAAEPEPASAQRDVNAPAKEASDAG